MKLLRGVRGGTQLSVGGFIFIRDGAPRKLSSGSYVVYWYCNQYGPDSARLKEDVHIIFGLPFLPSNEIVPAWNAIKAVLLLAHPQSKDFCQYMDSTWMDSRYPTAMWSCYERTLCNAARTNNVSEGANSAMKRFFSSSKPTLWTWISKMSDVQLKTDTVILQNAIGRSNASKKKRSQVERNSMLESDVSSYVFVSEHQRRIYLTIVSRYTKNG